MPGEPPPKTPQVPAQAAIKAYGGIKPPPEVSKFNMTFYHFYHLSEALKKMHDVLVACRYEDDQGGIMLRHAYRVLCVTVMIPKHAMPKESREKLERKMKLLQGRIRDSIGRRLAYSDYNALVDEMQEVLDLFYQCLQHLGLGIPKERQQSFEQRIEDRV